MLLPIAGCRSHAPAAAPSSDKPLLTDSSLQVGGEDVVMLHRDTPGTADTSTPQFTSVTIFPGRGFNTFQITANLPGRGEVPLMASPSVQEAAGKLNGGPGDPGGTASTSFGGGFLVPYPNRILGKLSADGNNITTSWQGHTLTLPADFAGKKPGAQKHSIHGLILASKIGDIQKTTTADGQRVTGFLHAGDFGGRWVSQTDLKFAIDLAADAVTATITAKNVGSVAEPMAIGWHPYFAIPSGNRAQARLHVPGAKLAAVNNYDDVFPTGELKPVAGTPYDFNAPGGKPLGQQFLDDNFSTLTRTNGAVEVQLIDPAAGYGLSIQGLSPEIKTVQVYAPPAKNFVAVEEQFNFGDPFGAEWHGADTGMVTLQPGQSVTWQVRLKLFVPPPAPDGPARAQ
ncbi:aldose 1-epimerase [Acidipila sp. EB88]|nr:aldose 1-epimerase [Acidipila sp. EB88]